VTPISFFGAWVIVFDCAVRNSAGDLRDSGAQSAGCGSVQTLRLSIIAPAATLSTNTAGDGSCSVCPIQDSDFADSPEGGRVNCVARPELSDPVKR
jgi:hypothetical protein